MRLLQLLQAILRCRSVYVRAHVDKLDLVCAVRACTLCVPVCLHMRIMQWGMGVCACVHVQVLMCACAPTLVSECACVCVCMFAY